MTNFAQNELNPRWEAARIIYGPGMKTWEFMEFISCAKRYAYSRNMGIYERAGYLMLDDHEKFTQACWDYACRDLPGVTPSDAAV